MLITTAQLTARLHAPAWVVFDCRHDLADHAKGARVYRAGHVPGAHFAPVETELSGPKTGANGRHPLPAPQAFADFLGRHGVTENSTVVAYDDVGGQYAARLWWMARWIGLTHVAVLDGGLPKWLATGGAMTTEVAVPRPTTLRARPVPGLVWTAAEVAQRVSQPTSVLLDARTPERYRGEVEQIDRVAGRIPGAVNRFFKTNLKADLTMRPAAELNQEFTALLAGRAAENVGHQCGSGVTACVNLFAMEYAGLPGSKLYPGSWSEWIADPTRPVARG